MKRFSRLGVWTSVAALLLTVAVAWSVAVMFEHRGAASRSEEDLAACRRLVGEIQSLRSGPTVAWAKDVGVQELGQRIQQASTAAGLDPASLQSVSPQPARRVGDSPYLDKPTALSFRGVALPSLVTMLVSLTRESALSVRDLRLRAPAGDEAGALWDAEVTLTYLLYSPRGKASNER